MSATDYLELWWARRSLSTDVYAEPSLDLIRSVAVEAYEEGVEQGRKIGYNRGYDDARRDNDGDIYNEI
jgi:hypothetical protein